ncbi:MAG: class GN sortase [Colwellia sp.]
MQSIIKTSLLVIGSLLCLHASWLPAKGWLSQQLISYSWHQSIDLKQKIKPWPWADTYPIAELLFQRLNKRVVVLNGGDATTLAFSAGAIAPFNLTMSKQPLVVAGHRDSHFSFLDEVFINDIISLTDENGQNQRYHVETIDIIDASAGYLPILANDSQLILITCYPFTNTSINSNERYVITALKI